MNITNIVHTAGAENPAVLHSVFLCSSGDFFEAAQKNGGLLSVGLAAQVLEISKQAVTGAVQASRITAFHYHGAVYVSGHDVRAWAERRGICQPQEAA